MRRSPWSRWSVRLLALFHPVTALLVAAGSQGPELPVTFVLECLVIGAIGAVVLPSVGSRPPLVRPEVELHLDGFSARWPGVDCPDQALVVALSQGVLTLIGCFLWMPIAFDWARGDASMLLAVVFCWPLGLFQGLATLPFRWLRNRALASEAGGLLVRGRHLVAGEVEWQLDPRDIYEGRTGSLVLVRGERRVDLRTPEGVGHHLVPLLEQARPTGQVGEVPSDLVDLVQGSPARREH